MSHTLENADDFGQGILKIGQGKVREFYFMKFVGTLVMHVWFHLLNMCSILFYFRMIFCDFGEDFTVYDVDGEQPISNMVAGIDRVNICTGN